jgi:very-short-patch-repair endonuclease
VEFATRTPSSIERGIREIASDQFGLVSREQAIEKGISTSAISRRLVESLWEAVLPGVYKIAGAPVSGRQAAMAAALWAGEGALVSHAAAGVLWGIDGIRTRRVELWVPNDRRPRSTLVVVHRGNRLDRADRTMQGPIPVTTPIRTLIDVAGRLEDDRLLAAMEDLFRRNLGTPERLRARLRALRRSGRLGAGRLEALLERRESGPPLESVLEAKLFLLLDRAGIPRPERQHWVVVSGGRYRLDFAWPELKVGLEAEGWSEHGGRAAWGKDRDRYAELTSVGWRVLPITWEAITQHADRVLRWVRDARLWAVA